MTTPAYRLDDRVRRGAWWLTFVALIPLLAQALLVVFAAPPVTFIALASQVLLGTLMLAFVGALHLGLLLVAGAAFSRMQIVVRLVWCGALLVTLLVDWRLYGGAAPVRTTGILPMRLVFTVVAVTCLVVTWAWA